MESRELLNDNDLDVFCICCPKTCKEEEKNVKVQCHRFYFVRSENVKSLFLSQFIISFHHHLFKCKTPTQHYCVFHPLCLFAHEDICPLSKNSGFRPSVSVIDKQINKERKSNNLFDTNIVSQNNNTTPTIEMTNGYFRETHIPLKCDTIVCLCVICDIKHCE